MVRDSRYDILFEPVRIGPVTAKNRFYQVPHCTGAGWQSPRVLAGLRAMKAEGGWAVVNTEYCSVHPSSDDTPYPMASLWDDGDVRAHALMTEKVHAHGALAGVELCLGGARMANHTTREVALGVVSMPLATGEPFQTRAMDREDIREVRRWHRNAVLRARRAGFDIVYVYATHDYLLSQFMSPVLNTRTDEYGGSLANRVRLVRELIEDAREAVGTTMAVAVRFSAETNGGDGGDGAPVPGETEDMFGILGDLPDLWDINVDDYSLEMGLSRFIAEGSLEAYVSTVRSLTGKPIVSVGRFTSPDSMASQVRRGVLDLVGAARPSIADPFLPRKIEEGRIDDIRECIGCNICYMGDARGAPIRCTQNPAMSEEWRRGWHPERFGTRRSDARILVIGAGPAGLEAAHVLGKRGYGVVLAEAARELGGRVTRESALPGLGEWRRVRDYRLGQLDKLDNVEIYRASRLAEDDVLELAADHVAVATGSRWRRDGFGASHRGGLAGLSPAERILTADDIMDGCAPEGRVVVYDDDHYYMGTVVAETLRSRGLATTLATPQDAVSAWGETTLDRWRAQKRMVSMGVELVLAHELVSFDGSAATFESAVSGAERTVAADWLVLVTARSPVDTLYHGLKRRMASGERGAPRTVRRIGDCEAPAIIAAAVFSGHRYGRELDTAVDPDNPLKHDRVFSGDPP